MGAVELENRAGQEVVRREEVRVPLRQPVQKLIRQEVNNDNCHLSLSDLVSRIPSRFIPVVLSRNNLLNTLEYIFQKKTIVTFKWSQENHHGVFMFLY